jgi:hypothetical protein
VSDLASERWSWTVDSDEQAAVVLGARRQPEADVWVAFGPEDP